MWCKKYSDIFPREAAAERNSFSSMSWNGKKKQKKRNEKAKWFWIRVYSYEFHQHQQQQQLVSYKPNICSCDLHLITAELPSGNTCERETRIALIGSRRASQTNLSVQTSWVIRVFVVPVFREQNADAIFLSFRNSDLLVTKVYIDLTVIQMSTSALWYTWALASTGKRGHFPHLPPAFWKCCKVFCASVVTAKRSVDELFMHHFHNLSTVGLWGRDALRLPLRLHPVPRPLICPPMEKIRGHPCTSTAMIFAGGGGALMGV